MAFKKTKGKVFVAMSGGVDSSVTATLLQRQGYDVTGVFMKVWHPSFLPCTWREERLDAMRVSAHLGIPLLTWDFEREYKEKVADYMISEYKAGRTPNPDVMCNKEIKFGAFFRRAIKEGANFVATGHYAEVRKNKKTGLYEMFASIDETKDQSYFLWTLGQKELSKTLFPVGKFKKSEVRKLAKKFGLPTATKKDSQGLCFVGKLEMKDFLAHFIKEKEGAVLNEESEVIGTHHGAWFYTLGERHGFTITKKETNDSPYYVIAKDILKNTLTVASAVSKNPLECATKEITLSDVNFCTGINPDTKKKYNVAVRYHGEPYECTLGQLAGEKLLLRLKKPAVVALGQSAVVYDGLLCLGGGIVEDI
ncbi:MAG: tRNA 2-thiouridine(34) synthase MnmA [Candidatus Pacebacteria bacterium]|nr:tRNA 2-thiouridine(34) synthase MnmA [Candidatus Paceibacterota bacterium]